MKSSSKQVLSDLVINPSEDSIFQGGLEWNDIPKLSVLVGVNGSGKTKLLEKIQEKLGVAKLQGKSFFKKHNDDSVIFKKDFDRHCNDKENIKFVRNLRSIKQGSSYQNPSAPNLEESDPKNHAIIRDIESIHDCNLLYLSNDEINDLANKISRETIQENFTDMKIEGKFIRFCEIKTDLEAESSLMESSTCKDRREFVNKGLIDALGSSTPPWEVINNTLSRWGFEFKFAKPVIRGEYRQKFIAKGGREIFFDNLSEGEKVIIELILWSYDTGSNLRSGNHGKLLMLDEFDAHLNPSMAEAFISVVKNILIREFNVQVIMTTHSPSTVSYCDEGDLFWMDGGSFIQRSKREII